MSFKAFVITLTSRTDRVDSMKSFYSTSPIPINLFYGLPKDEVRAIKKNITTSFCNYVCTTSMVGCASSHIFLWDHLINNFNEDEIFIIIEDDTFLDMEKLLTLESDIKSLFASHNNKIFLQLTGEGFLKKEKMIHKNLFLSTYKVHVFLGAYMISAKVARELVDYYGKNKIDYHIDLSLNRAMRELEIKPMILENKIAVQKGMTNSNMLSKDSSNGRILYNPDKAEHLFYALNFPIIQIFDIIISFTFLFFLILIVLFFFIKNPFLFIFIGMVLPEIIVFD